jgi:sialic acid synthase SpsE
MRDHLKKLQYDLSHIKKAGVSFIRIPSKDVEHSDLLKRFAQRYKIENVILSVNACESLYIQVFNNV